jgi:hypothetical protein
MRLGASPYGSDPGAALAFAGDLVAAPGGPPIWLAGRRPTMQLAPIATRWFDAGGTLLAHRIYVEAGDDVPDGVHVARHVLSGSAAALADGLARYHRLGAGDCSILLGHDDRSAHRTLDVLVADVLPDLGW